MPERSSATTSLPPDSSRSILNTSPDALPLGRVLAGREQAGQGVQELPDALAAEGGPDQDGYVGVEPLAHLELDELGVGARAVDLVHEHDRRDAQPLQRAHQHQRLRLDALDGGHDQHGAVQQARASARPRR